MAKTKKETIKALLIIPLGLTILILLATSIIALRKLHDHHINQEARKSLNELDQLFQMELNEDADKLAGIIEFLQKDKDLQNAWLARDRQSLLGYALPIFEGIRSRHHVTHFYFHSLDSVNFLRVHKPKRHGDHIDRFTMKQAASSGKDSWGIELGPLGMFTLRYVYPWQIDGKLAGYIELGEDHLVLLQKILCQSFRVKYRHTAQVFILQFLITIQECHNIIFIIHITADHPVHNNSHGSSSINNYILLICRPYRDHLIKHLN